MKTQVRIFGFIIGLSVVLLSCNACSKDEGGTMPPENGGGDNGKIVTANGISEEELETYAGDIGIVLEARKVVKKGYRPVKAKVTVNATSGDFSKTFDLNEYSFMGQLKLSLEDLDEAAINELTDGVEIVTELLAADGATIVKETFSKISFLSDPATLAVDGNNLTDLNTGIYLKKNTPYYVQIVSDGIPIKGAMKLNPIPLAFAHITQTSGVEFTGDEDALLFSFEAFEGETNTYAIKHIATNRYLRINRNYIGYPTGNTFNPAIHQAIVADINWQFPQDFIGKPDARFVIEKEDDGVYNIQSVNGERVKVASGVGYTLNHPAGKNLTLRFVPMNIDWTIESFETLFLEPILPPAKTGFGFNSTLINCGNGSLEQKVGVEVSETISTTTGWEESVSLSSIHTASVSTTVGVEVTGSFFGNGATFSAEVTGGYEYTTTSATETSNWSEATTETTETYFSERTVTVPSKNASLVYDAIQTYDNIKINFVQRLRVRAAEYDTGEALSGDEINTQFHFNNFNGVVTEIGSDYIEITLRGVTLLDKVIKTKSEVREADPMCGE